MIGDASGSRQRCTWGTEEPSDSNNAIYELHSTNGIYLDTKAGDVVIFHPWCIHAASRNFTDSARVRFMGNATVRYRENRFKPWFTSETSDDPNVRAATSAP